MKGNEFAKINLINLEVESSSFKNKDLSFIIKTTKEYQKEFERKWDEYFNQSKEC